MFIFRWLVHFELIISILVRFLSCFWVIPSRLVMDFSFPWHIHYSWISLVKLILISTSCHFCIICWFFPLGYPEIQNNLPWYWLLRSAPVGFGPVRSGLVRSAFGFVLARGLACGFGKVRLSYKESVCIRNKQHF